MSLSQTRPIWLTSFNELERYLKEQNFKIGLSELRTNRAACPLVPQLLEFSIPHDQKPSGLELELARTHLAMDLQLILKKWCEEGLRETFKGILGTDFGNMLGLHNQNDPLGELKQLTLSSPQSSCPPTLQSPRNLDSSMEGRASSIPLKRPPEDDEDDAPEIKSPKLYNLPVSAISPEKNFRCPYNVMNPCDHPECASKIFPNPRKLKEHVWRFTKPFKCGTCGEGFGREKTRAIHCEQRKVKCIEAHSSYEGSPEQQRDRRIDIAKSTKEMVEIFQDYETEAKNKTFVRAREEMSNSLTDASAPPEEASPTATEWSSQPFSPNPHQPLVTSPTHHQLSSYISMTQPDTSMDLEGDSGGAQFGNSHRRASMSNLNIFHPDRESLDADASSQSMLSNWDADGMSSQGGENTLLAIYPSFPRPQSAPPNARVGVPWNDAETTQHNYQQQHPPNLSLMIPVPEIIVTHPESPAITGLSSGEHSPFPSQVGFPSLPFEYPRNIEPQTPELQLNGSEMQLDQHSKQLGEIAASYNFSMPSDQSMPSFSVQHDRYMKDEGSPTSPVVPMISHGWGAFEGFQYSMKTSSGRKRR